MIAITKTRYKCDFCQKDIVAHDVPLELSIVVSSPSYLQGAASGEFCSPDCASKWTNKFALVKLLSKGMAK